PAYNPKAVQSAGNSSHLFNYPVFYKVGFCTDSNNELISSDESCVPPDPQSSTYYTDLPSWLPGAIAVPGETNSVVPLYIRGYLRFTHSNLV
ncbi:hypothetical protein ABTU79_19945, partial [Acinetobacter baumannii]